MSCVIGESSTVSSLEETESEGSGRREARKEK